MSRRTNSEELRGYKEAVDDLRNDNDRLNQQLANITQQLVSSQEHKNTLMQQNEMLRSIISEMQAGLAVERDHMMRDAASAVRRGSMRSRPFGSRRMTGGCNICGCRKKKTRKMKGKKK